jgi:4-amino-4-deoxy-L-arabinose transferase-like glycosyltransferase
LKNWREHLGIVILLIAFALLAGAYSVIVPLYEAPDEPAHFDYVRHLVEEHRLPIQKEGALSEAHQPPLYYVIAALVSSVADFDDPAGTQQVNPQFVWGGRGGAEHNAALHHTAETFPYRGLALAAHLCRFVSVLSGLVTVFFTYALAGEIFPGQEHLALLAAGLVAFNPQFLFISGAINPDSMAAMWSTVALWQMVRLLREPLHGRGWTLLGLLIGLAVLSKSSTFTLGLMAAGILLFTARRQRSWSLLWKGVLAVGIASALVSGWWFVRNQLLYGDPLGWQTFVRTYAVHLRESPFSLAEVRWFIRTQFRSYWGVFGWMTVQAPEGFYRAILALCALSLVGWGKWAIRREWSNLGAGQRGGSVILASFPLMQEAYQLRAVTVFNPAWYQGRHVFPMIAPVAVLLAAGLFHLLPDRGRIVVSLVTTLGLAATAIWILRFLIVPTYPMIPLPKWRMWFLPYRYDVIFGDYFRLRGCELDMGTWEEQRELTLSLYWETIGYPELDYSVFVHLVDSVGAMAAQYDEAPGTRLACPPSSWSLGDIVPSVHPLSVPPNLPAGRYSFRIGVYFWADGHRLPAMEKGIPIGDFFVPEEPFLEIGQGE